MLIAKVVPVPPAVTPQDSIAGWVWLAVALAAVLVAGLVLTSRR